MNIVAVYLHMHMVESQKVFIKHINIWEKLDSTSLLKIIKYEKPGFLHKYPVFFTWPTYLLYIYIYILYLLHNWTFYFHDVPINSLFPPIPQNPERLYRLKNAEWTLANMNIPTTIVSYINENYETIATTLPLPCCEAVQQLRQTFRAEDAMTCHSIHGCP